MLNVGFTQDKSIKKTEMINWSWKVFALQITVMYSPLTFYATGHT